VKEAVVSTWRSWRDQKLGTLSAEEWAPAASKDRIARPQGRKAAILGGGSNRDLTASRWANSTAVTEAAGTGKPGKGGSAGEVVWRV
jgi:hypothetical protein